MNVVPGVALNGSLTVCRGPTGVVELAKSLAGKFRDITGNSPAGLSAAITNVERGRSHFLYGALSKIGAAWNKQTQRAHAAAWREALSNTDMGRIMANMAPAKQPTPMQVRKMHACLLAAGLLHPSNTLKIRDCNPALTPRAAIAVALTEGGIPTRVIGACGRWCRLGGGADRGVAGYVRSAYLSIITGNYPTGVGG